MKLKLICLILTGVAIGSVSAQKSSVFLKGGLNMANVSIAKDGSIDDAKTLVSFHAGLQGDIPIVPFLSLQPGIFFTGKGSKTQSGNTTDQSYYKATSNPMYIEVPVNVVLKVPMGRD